MGIPRIVYLVLDGAAGDPGLGPTAYSTASKPGLDRIAREGVCGLAYTIGKGIAPESDAAVLSILGYDPEKYYPGRGPLEALGAGLEVEEGQIALRGNFATLDPHTTWLKMSRPRRLVPNQWSADGGCMRMTLPSLV